MASTINSTQARSNLYKLIDEVATSHNPVIITGKKHNVVLVAQNDWDSIQETLYLTSIPGMRESIVEGLNESIEHCSKELDW